MRKERRQRKGRRKGKRDHENGERPNRKVKKCE